MKRSFAYLFCLMQLSVPFCLAMESNQKPELPETTLGIFKREHVSLGCELVKAGAAGSLATFMGSTWLSIAYPPALIPAFPIMMGSLKTLAGLTPALIACMAHGQTPEEKMPEHLRPAYKTARTFTQGTIDILTEHSADLFAMAQVGGMVYEKLHTPANTLPTTSPTPQQSIEQQYENLKKVLPEEINVPKPEAFFTKEWQQKQLDAAQHRHITQKAGQKVLIDLLKEKIAAAKVTSAIDARQAQFKHVIPLLHQDYSKQSSQLHTISLAERTILVEQNKTISQKIAAELTTPQLHQSGFIQEVVPAIVPYVPSSTVSNLLYGFASHAGTTDPFEKEEWLQTLGKDVIGSQTLSGTAPIPNSNQTVSAGTHPFSIINLIRDTVKYVLHPRESALNRIQANRKNRTDGNIRVDTCGIIHQSTSAEEQSLHDIATWAQDCLDNPDTSSKAKLHAKQILQNIQTKEQAESIIQKNGAQNVDSNVIRSAKKSTQHIERLRDTLASEIGTSPGSNYCMYLNDETPIRQTRRDTVRQCVRYEKQQCIKRKQELVAIIDTYNKNCSKIKSEKEIQKQTCIVSEAQKELSSINGALANMADHDAIVAIHKKSLGGTTDYGTQWHTDSTYDFLGSAACKQFEKQYAHALHHDGKHPVLYANTSEARAQAYTMYNAFRKSYYDVHRIARNTGISVEVIQQVKNHLLIDQHELQGSNGRIVKKQFDPNINVANTWKRLVDGTYIDADLNLLKHEYHESYLMKEQGLSYAEAHKIASGEVEQEISLSNKRSIDKSNVSTKFITPIDNGPKDMVTACPGGALPQEKPTGCGDTTPKVDPQLPGFEITPPQDPVDCKFPGEPVKPILHFEQTIDIEEMLDKVIQNLPDVRKFGHDNSELRQRVARSTFDEAVKIVKENTSPISIKEVMTNKGPLVVFDYGNDNKIVVRKHSLGIERDNIPGLPTIEVQRKGTRFQDKIRLDGEQVSESEL